MEHYTPHAKASVKNAQRESDRNALKISESRYRRLFETAQDGILLLNAETAQIEDVNPYLINMLNYTHSEFLGKKLWEVGAFADIKESKEMFMELQHKGYVRYESLPLRTSMGVNVDVEFVSNSYDCEGIKVIQCNVRNITERKLVEKKLERHTRLYAALSQCNKAIVHCVREDELFSQVCRAAVKFGGMKMAWIGVIDTVSRMVLPASGFGQGAEFLGSFKFSMDANSPYGAGPTCIAIRENRPYWCQDLLNDPATTPWRTLIKRADLASSASLPLIRNGVVIGAFVLYSDMKHAFDKLARNLLADMATDLSFALDNLDRQSQRQRSELALSESEAQLDLALRSASMGVWNFDVVANKRSYDDQACLLLGIDRATFTGTAEEFMQIVDPDDQEMIKLMLAQTIEQGVPYEPEFRVVWPDGSIHYLASRGMLSRDDQGRPLRINGIVFDITVWKETQEQLHSLAFYDPLTILPNRRLLTDRLQQALASSSRSKLVGAILFIDLDHFKTVNDTLGHALGNSLLQQTAIRLTSCVREGDTVARLGGDEFVVILEHLSADEAEAATQTKSIGEKILFGLSRPYQIASHQCRITCSMGITLFNDRHQQPDELLKQADIAMYEVKKAGRNTLRFFDAHMQDIITARATLERELEIALEMQQFQIYYQVQVDDSQKTIGAEALIRWNHPSRGLVLPKHFIPLAEENGLILPIGQWVLETACAQIKAWEQDDRTSRLVLAVNVSAREFRDADFVAHIKACVRRHAIDPKRLKLELTESLLLENIESIIAIMHGLNDTGIQFSLDDFGTGYSSLQYLKRLPLNQIKIDQSFVHDLAVDSGRTIVFTIIAMAKSLNLDVIAEGVETEAQLQMLLHKGCHHFQGNLFGMPVPIEQFNGH